MIATISQLRAALAEANVIAFLRVIRQHESAQTDNAYHMRYPGKTFYDLTTHPRIFEPIPGKTLKSSAAGAYQITATTYDNLRKLYGLPDSFQTDAQDLLAVALHAAHTLWTSLPGGEENHGYTVNEAEQVFMQWGGSVPQQQEAAPIEEVTLPEDTSEPNFFISEPPTPSGDNTMADSSPGLGIGSLLTGIATAINPVAGLVVGLAGSLINAFSPLAKEKITKELARHDIPVEVSGQIYDTVVQAAQKMTGKSDPVDATAAARNDAAILAQLEQIALDKLAAMGPLLDKMNTWQKDAWAAEQTGRDSAAKRAQGDKWDMTKLLVLFAGITTTGMVFAILATILWQVVAGHEPSVALVGLGGPLFMAAIKCWSEIFAYRFDGTKTSDASALASHELATMSAQGNRR